MSDFEPIVGLEIHAQLLTASKIFCSCSAAFGGEPNTHICAVCLGLPGALPVLNHAAVDCAIRAALALGCTIQATSVFARKNYFYPDLPKGYQISQYERPVATDGVVRTGSDYWTPDYDIRIKRVHLEEDAGKLVHEGFSDSGRASYVDLNRAGVPLVEIVTEPDFHGTEAPKHAAQFFAYLRELLMRIGVNDGNMEEGSLRCDANVSVRPRGSGALGTKTEIKNLNSFRFVEKALTYEIDRQIAVVRDAGRVVQETRLWDTARGQTISMRTKEEAHDYRYFPEPDLPPLLVSHERVDSMRAALPELPAARRKRYQAAPYSLSARDAASLTQVIPEYDAYFEEAVAAGVPAKTAKNWMLGQVLARMNDLRLEHARELRARVTPAALSGLLLLVERGSISGPVAKDVFDKMFESGRTAEEIVSSDGLTQLDDASQILEVVSGVLSRHPEAVAQYRAGKASALGFLVGQVMRATGGTANPRRVNELLKQQLDQP
jgi:aspartyl-tRNA(Asn)/glutamyl-tRNA(Gln) amidotransferase subunit B